MHNYQTIFFLHGNGGYYNAIATINWITEICFINLSYYPYFLFICSGIETLNSSQENKNVVCQSKENPVVKDARRNCLGERSNQATVVDDETVNLAHHAEGEIQQYCVNICSVCIHLEL